MMNMNQSLGILFQSSRVGMPLCPRGQRLQQRGHKGMPTLLGFELGQTMKKLFISRLFLGLIFLFSFNAAHCQGQSDASIIAHLRQTNVSAIDAQLASMPYEAWLKKTLGDDATIDWELDDCGEGANSEGSWPLCVTAIGKFKEHGEVIIAIGVGHSEKGVFGKPSVVNINVEGVGPSRSFSNLHQLPDYLRESEDEKYSATQFSDKLLDEQSAINFAQNIDIRTLIPTQPNQILLRWIEALAGPNTTVTWKLDGCDRVAISMQLTGYRDYRACVFAHLENKDESALVSINVGTYRKGLAFIPKVALVQVYNKRRINITTPTISELQDKLADMRRGDHVNK